MHTTATLHGRIDSTCVRDSSSVHPSLNLALGCDTCKSAPARWTARVHVWPCRMDHVLMCGTCLEYYRAIELPQPCAACGELFESRGQLVGCIAPIGGA
ncbi:hypothetical protein C8E05_3823 [Rhodococcus wratislaviensis]|uniref:Uncharacterized protein n=1 Tax=Rhodococcus wratislaviensis TaxID=44752 RepID=A0AB38FKD7_RHOWR|nr:hypothetical protein C8E05_3823 [Rhodococcus wratislaviensis]SPZ42075.1 Uncharacterised protein [Rhodococcus wratislaviensis]